MRPITVSATVVCWHCSQKLDPSAGDSTARYLYRGDQPHTVVVEDWLRCTCGAYQNVRRLNEISVETLGKV